MRPSSSATTVTTVWPVPSSRAGTPANARWRSTRSGSAASSRARSRSPPAAPAISSARSGGVPSATRRAAIVLVGDRRELDAHAARRDRDQLRRHESASTMKSVVGGGSSIVFSSRAAPSALSRWNSWRMITLRAPSTGASDAWRMISPPDRRRWRARRAGPRGRRGARRRARAGRRGCRRRRRRR